MPPLFIVIPSAPMSLRAPYVIPNAPTVIPNGVRNLRSSFDGLLITTTVPRVSGTLDSSECAPQNDREEALLMPPLFIVIPSAPMSLRSPYVIPSPLCHSERSEESKIFL